MSLSVVRSFNTPAEAEVACAALQSAGIPAVVLDQYQAWVTPVLALGFRVGVPDQHLAEAAEILKSGVGGEALAPEEAIAPTADERPWLLAVLLMISGLAAAWGVRELLWWRFVEPDGLAVVSRYYEGQLFWAALLAVCAAAVLYLFAGFRRYRTGRPVFGVWLAGFACAVTADVIAMAGVARMSAADPEYAGVWGAWDYFSVYLAGHVAIGAVGVMLFVVERREARTRSAAVHR